MRLIQNIYFLLILAVFLIAAVNSVSAADINNNNEMDLNDLQSDSNELNVNNPESKNSKINLNTESAEKVL